MAIIKRGILGGFSNKIGNVVGTSWKGISVMRSLPQSVHNPKTEAQEKQRTNFAVASKLGSQLLDAVIKPFWDKRAIRMSGYNLWVQKNLDHWRRFGTSYNDFVIIAEGAPIEIIRYEAFYDDVTLAVGAELEFKCTRIDSETARAIGVIVSSDGTEILGIAEQNREDDIFRFPCINASNGVRGVFYAFAYDPITMATTGQAYASVRVE